jgi:hypothetical protein
MTDTGVEDEDDEGSGDGDDRFSYWFIRRTDSRTSRSVPLLFDPQYYSDSLASILPFENVPLTFSVISSLEPGLSYVRPN